MRKLQEYTAEKRFERNQLASRCVTTDKHEQRKKLLQAAWAKGTAGINKQQIDLINQKQLREKNDDVTYGIQLARNLGYEKPGAKKATKEPNGTIMDQLFSTKVHKAYQMGKKVEQSTVYPIQTRVNNIKAEEQRRFDDKYTIGGTLLDLQTRMTSDVRQLKSGMQKRDMARALS